MAQDVNIGAKLGSEMFGFMWVAAGFSLLGAGVQVGLWCCCRGRTARKSGRRKGGFGADGGGGGRDEEVVEEKTSTRRRLKVGRRKQ